MKASAEENQTTDTLVQTACKDVKVKITINDTMYETSNESISTSALTKHTSMPVKVELTYSDTNAVDRDFDIDFRSITLNYNSPDGE